MMDVSEHDNPCLILIFVFVECILVFVSTCVHTGLLLSPAICKLFVLSSSIGIVNHKDLRYIQHERLGMNFIEAKSYYFLFCTVIVCLKR